MKRRGFTILELLVVMSIMAVLATIVTVTAQGVIKTSREQRRDVMRGVLQEGINTYKFRTGKWPGGIESYASEGKDHVFTNGEADKIFQVVVQGSVSRTNAQYLDPHGLFVAPTGVSARSGGLNFDEAFRKNPPKGYRHLNVNQMALGYSDPEKGYFERFRVKYNAATDTVTVQNTPERDKLNRSK